MACVAGCASLKHVRFLPVLATEGEVIVEQNGTQAFWVEPELRLAIAKGDVWDWVPDVSPIPEGGILLSIVNEGKEPLLLSRDSFVLADVRFVISVPPFSAPPQALVWTPEELRSTPHIGFQESDNPSKSDVRLQPIRRENL